MELKYEKKPALTFIGYSAEIKPNEGYIKCPEFWENEYTKKYAHLWQTGKPETPTEKAIFTNQIGMFALCLMNPDESFEYAIAGIYQGGEVPEGMKLYSLPESEYAVFMERGPMSFKTLNEAVWGGWYPTEGQKFEPNGMTTIEVYSAGNPMSDDYEYGMWIPVRRK